MQTRETFHTGLLSLKESIVQLGYEVNRVFDDVMIALMTSEVSMLEKVKENDKNINRSEIEINEKATLLIARQQPVASDLRKIIVAIKVSSDLERVGDLAVNIAKASFRILNSKVDMSLLIEMNQLASQMLNSSIAAYENGNIVNAHEVARLDDRVDEMYAQFVKQIFNLMILEQAEVEQITQLAFISRYIERIADHATNIAELTIYEVNGQYFDLN